MTFLVDELIEFCEKREKFVHLERTQRSCARAERCEHPARCPLASYFRRSPAVQPRRHAFELGYE